MSIMNKLLFLLGQPGSKNSKFVPCRLERDATVTELNVEVTVKP